MATRYVIAALRLGFALLIPVYVAFARMYRGMHHPLDIAGGVLIGVAALSAIVLVSQASGLATRVRP
jgi:membrane-associated phospholipid phosphatase